MYNGFAIILAWPETFCKQPTSWYDPILRWIGINKNYYYKVGHAAIILIESKSGNCYYFDFGRYHAPFQYGRVRDQETDPDLKIRTKAKISMNKILNVESILNEVVNNPSCHGDGDLYASYIPINFNSAYKTAKNLQKNFIPYGPFLWNGSNCSRFVQTIVLSGKPSFFNRLKIILQKTITPTPLGNVRSFSNEIRLSPNVFHKDDQNKEKTPKKAKPTFTLPPPERNPKIPHKAKWLAGEGAGSWFYIKQINSDIINVTRFSPEGKIEFSGFFQTNNNKTFVEKESYQITYPSHFQQISIIQKNQLFIFKKLNIIPFDEELDENIFNQKNQIVILN
ncbi:MAG: hypothetical protein KatS3mg027_0762 [Bacteroidia bacterium]|nr:MAG: hypothetical protein KatS3mg027_0762 [Bacteroidia bacterium]